MNTPESEIGRLVDQAVGAMHTAMGAHLRAAGLSPLEWAVLRHVYRAGHRGGRARAADIVSHVEISHEQVRSLLVALKTRGLVRLDDSGGARLTTDAERIMPALVSEADEIISRATAGFTGDEKQALVGLLRRYVENLAS
ncbi:MAG: MarR family transcriptional regulator [Actinomycetota bacterium]|nr:MarR family transcriptional regulator [Actinomycetota bacterium]